MDDKKVLEGLLEAHQLLRHDFMNNLQVIMGYQQIGQPEKANEYIQKTITFLRSFSGLGKTEAPLLQGLLIMYLTRYSGLLTGFQVKVSSKLLLLPEEECALTGLLHNIMGELEQLLKENELLCNLSIGSEPNELLCFILEGQSVSLLRAQEKIAPLLKNTQFICEMVQKGNTIQVKILRGC